MQKSFDELTIADDYMFCTVMQDEQLCKELLTIILKDKVGKIVRLFKQKPIENQIASKGIRLDIMIEDDKGKLYDIEMQTTNERNLPKRMRYYQSAIDNSAINKGEDYNDLPYTFIIFLCTFDYMEKGLPIYTIIPYCKESKQEFNDFTTKIILNSTAWEKAEENLKEFLSYMNGQYPSSRFTERIEAMVSKTKEDEQKRREYMLLKSFEMDAKRAGRDEGIKAGIAQGMQAGIAKGLLQGRSEGMQAGIAKGLLQGRSEGMQAGLAKGKLETAKNLIIIGLSIEKIAKATGLSVEEIEKLYKEIK